jgi:hypothetical protein
MKFISWKNEDYGIFDDGQFKKIELWYVLIILNNF